MRKIIQWILAGLVVIGAVLMFYFYYPEIWGEVFYPLKYKEEILSASQEFQIPRNLISAVIFHESHFNPDVKSPAGASGLMQLMPATARGVAKRIGIDDYTDSKIFDPITNIRLGTAYIKSYWDLYNQDIDSILVAYNAGPSYSGSFIQSKSHNTIPRETSNYIRRVKATWMAYDKIYGSEWQGSQKPFQPEKESFIDRIDIFNLLDLLRK
ncbi:MAG: soluble lytic murein transglycosylase [Candidatus Berkelbacteria bacterium Licking1014_7]|uniref:Soluble lytic murein transglycosylase n=1 Tax=Candidatus Berkelbacteria bacterium Licking1014_7 TaxID=2017147 RepID=A0A554LIV5_9BACT|nr:MAG: soluble lytic murein transglycosylase [Candidatus Berkelbacteria bacterium Licking1014_7]